MDNVEKILLFTRIDWEIWGITQLPKGITSLVDTILCYVRLSGWLVGYRALEMINN